jgi:hypothetical protein
MGSTFTLKDKLRHDVLKVSIAAAAINCRIFRFRKEDRCK